MIAIKCNSTSFSFLATLLFLLATLSGSTAFGQPITHVPLYTFFGDNDGSLFGNSVSGAGDVNGDGFADLIVGAESDSTNGADSGMARVYSGADGSTLFTFYGSNPSDKFGNSVSGAGDINGDGRDDVIVGALGTSNNTGSATVFSGLDGSVILNLNGNFAGDEFGSAVSDAGDVNNDGRADLIIGSQLADTNFFNIGTAVVISGLDGATLHTFHGVPPGGTRFGASVSGAGDIDGDGHADLIVGATAEGQANGSARVFSGSTGMELFTFFGDGPVHRFGASVDGVGDLNNDGRDDFIVGASIGDANGRFLNGYARVFSGIDGTVLRNFTGNQSADFLGSSVGGVGDLNGDGLNDLLVGAPGEFGGSARIYSGRSPGRPNDTLEIFYGGIGDNFGTSVSGVGDVNGDGINDFVVGAPNGIDTGYARVFVSQIPIPEPSSVTLATLAGLAMVLRVVHQNRK